MKKFIVLALSLALTFGLVACVAEPEEEFHVGGNTVILYLPCPDGTQAFETMEARFNGSITNIALLLVEHGALPQDSELMDLHHRSDGEITLEFTIDMNEAFLQGLLQMGSSGEFAIMGSLVRTFLTHFDADSVIVTVGGAFIETGHNVYDWPLTYDCFG